MSKDHIAYMLAAAYWRGVIVARRRWWLAADVSREEEVVRDYAADHWQRWVTTARMARSLDSKFRGDADV